MGLKRRGKHILVTLFTVVTMVIGVIPACACSHHAVKTETKTDATSCHSHVEPDATTGKAAADSTSVSSTENCVCTVSQVSPSDSSNASKIKKELAEISVDDSFQIVFSLNSSFSVASHPTVYFYADTSYNIPLRRGPPRL